MTLLQKRIVEVVFSAGSLRAAAKWLDVDSGCLSRLQSGEKDNPSDELLAKLGLRRKVVYERIRERVKSRR